MRLNGKPRWRSSIRAHADAGSLRMMGSSAGHRHCYQPYAKGDDDGPQNRLAHAQLGETLVLREAAGGYATRCSS
jgi:hypothetical protein